MYRLLFMTVLRRFDPETAHHLAFVAIRAAARVPGLHGLLRRLLAPPRDGAVEALGTRFPGPFGLAAGFDKTAVGVRGLTMLGFSYIEVGTITAQAQPGNEKPRSWRIIELGALRNRMGFNNDGAAAAAEQLTKLRRSALGRRLVVGVNIGKTKVTPVEEAAADYATSAQTLAPYADFLVVNVSSPNTPGLRDLQATELLRPILEVVRSASTEAAGHPVPLLVKIAPDLSDGDVDAIADLALELGLDGVVAVNTTINHEFGPGGLSGPPLLERGLQVVARLRKRLGEGPVIIGGGGITTVDDAQRYLDAGATLLQGFTGFIYVGPFWGSRVNRGLARSRRP